MENAKGQAATRRVNFTNTFIREVPLPESGRVIYWDTKERNLGLRATPSGRTLFIRVRVTGENVSKVKEQNLDNQNDVKEVRDEAAARRIELRNGIDRAEVQKRAREQLLKDEAAQRVKSMTLAEALEKYIAARSSGQKPISDRTASEYRNLVSNMLGKVKDKPLEEFTRPFCETLINQLAADIIARSRKSIKESGDTERTERTGVRANYALRLIRVLCLAYRVGNRDWGKCEGFEFPWRAEKAKRTTLDQEYNHGSAIWKALSKHRCDSGANYVKAVLLTGCRRGELSGLKVEQVNLEKRTITLETTKNGDPHIIYMSDQLVDLIKPLLNHRNKDKKIKPEDKPLGAPKVKGEKVFEGAGDPRKLLIAVGKEIGESFTLHSLRKYFASTCSNLDVPYPVLKACLNHRTEKSRDVTLRHYAHAKPSQMRAAWQRYADTIVPSSAVVIDLNSRRSAA